jgi:EmrB/QacA subfamily drug resistance transporter
LHNCPPRTINGRVNAPEAALAARSGKRAALFVTTLSSFLGPFMGSAVTVALPAIGARFAMSAVGLSWVSMAFLLSVGALVIPFGRLADLRGRKTLFVAGTVVYMLASALAARSQDAAMLVAARVLQGVGASMTVGTGAAILTSVFGPGERGRALGINVAAVYSGLSLGPFVGGIITQHLSWRFIFGMNVPLGLAIVWTAARMLERDTGEGRGSRFDWPGALLLGAALAVLMFGLSELNTTWGAGLVVLGLAGLGAFVAVEVRSPNPMVDMKLFRQNQVFAFSNLAALVNYSATFAVTFLLSLYLQYVKRLSPRDAGTLLVAQPIVQAAFSPLAGRLSDRVDAGVLASIGMAVTGIGVALLGFVGADTSLVYVAICLVLLGVGFGLFSSPNTNAVMGAVTQRQLGVAGSILSTMRSLGMILSMGVVSLLFALLIGGRPIGEAEVPAFLRSMRLAFAVFSVLSVAGIVASLQRNRRTAR